MNSFVQILLTSFLTLILFILVIVIMVNGVKDKLVYEVDNIIVEFKKEIRSSIGSLSVPR